MSFGGACVHLTALSENIVCIGGSRGTEVLSTEVLVLGQPAELYSLQSYLEAVCDFLLPVFSHQRKRLTNLFQNHSETLTSLFCLSFKSYLECFSYGRCSLFKNNF